jgi:hypothetical protein
MFGARLWIFLMLSADFIGSMYCEIELTCNYHQYDEGYACQVFGEDIESETETVSFSGDHLEENDDDSVTMLAFYQCEVKYIPANLFSNFDNIQWFECDGCNLIKIGQKDFENVGKLKTLKLQSGDISKIQNETFHYCPGLESLNLHANDITEIELNAFAGLKKLEKLYLFKNRIQSLAPGIFDDLINLEILNLDDNKIEKLDAGLFKFNKKLKEIEIAYNRIAVLDPNLISHLDGLTNFDFRYNDCGNREEFYNNEPANIQSTFSKYAPKCTEKNRLENKFKAKLNEIEKLKDTVVKKKQNYKQCEIKVSQLTQKCDNASKLDVVDV